MTKPTLVITRVRMLHFTRQYKQGRIESKQGGPVHKKMWGPHLEKDWLAFLVITVCQLSVLQCHPYLFLVKNGGLFGVITVAFICHSFIRVLPIILGMLLCCKKFAAPLMGPLFVGPLFGRTCITCLNPPLSIKTPFKRD